MATDNLQTRNRRRPNAIGDKEKTVAEDKNEETNNEVPQGSRKLRKIDQNDARKSQPKSKEGTPNHQNDEKNVQAADYLINESSDKENSENENPNESKNKTKKEKNKNEKTNETKEKKILKPKNSRQFSEDENTQTQPRLTKGRTVQFKLKKSDAWRSGWVLEVNEKQVLVRYRVDKNKILNYDEAWIDKTGDKIEIFSRYEHKRNIEDTLGAFEKLNI